jgi:uncharacterized protein YndB with AHSA1/START domain
MDTQLTNAGDASRAQSAYEPCQSIITPWTVSVTVSINTVARRIFQALTVPEYLETWLRMPGDDPDCYIAALQYSNYYRLDRYRRGGVDVSVKGSYRIFRRNKLHFTWQKHAESATPESLVQIRLHGDFGRTTMRLKHVGLPSPEQHLWHQEMWELSLARLASLF